MGYEYIYVSVIAVFIIHMLVYRKNRLIGSLLYLFLSILLIQPMIDASLSIGIPIIMIIGSLIGIIYEGIQH